MGIQEATSERDQAEEETVLVVSSRGTMMYHHMHTRYWTFNAVLDVVRCPAALRWGNTLRPARSQTM